MINKNINRFIRWFHMYFRKLLRILVTNKWSKIKLTDNNNTWDDEPACKIQWSNVCISHKASRKLRLTIWDSEERLRDSSKVGFQKRLCWHLWCIWALRRWAFGCGAFLASLAFVELVGARNLRLHQKERDPLIWIERWVMLRRKIK